MKKLMTPAAVLLALTVPVATVLASPLGGKLVLQPRAGDALDGLTKVQTGLFLAGQVSYQTPFTNESGLGPVMNKSNCASCHSNPLGGWGSISVTRFGADDKGEFVPLEHLGGTLLQSLSISAGCAESVPAEATVIITRLSNASMAYGLIEAIPDAAIAANNDPNDLNGDGISGRVHWVLPLESSPTSPLRAGRFGWKAQVATVLTFSGDATRNELGISNALIPTDSAPNGDMAMLASCDVAADPEDVADANGQTFIQRVTSFQRYLAQPPQTPRLGMTGETIFNNIGCNKCHVAQWSTANMPKLESAISNKTIRPYSDFLLHDMGLLGDGIQDGDATEQEFRTPVLWNLRTRDPMLHNGQASGGLFADRVTAAINFHGPYGEGAASAANFAALNTSDRNKLIAFLDSLGREEFDFDGDGEILLSDLAALSACRADASITPDEACAIGDINADGVVNIVDAGMFLQAAAREGMDVTQDCDNDGTVDLIEIFNGAADVDENGVPDTCIACLGDMNSDGFVGGADIAALLNAWGTAGGDLTGDGNTGGADLAALLNAWGVCP